LSNLTLQKDGIMKDLKKLYSSRSKASLIGSDTYKINEDEYLINKSVEALKNNDTYDITQPDGTVIKKFLLLLIYEIIL